MVSSGVVWCCKGDQWIPLQLSSIRLHGIITQAHWAAVSDFLQSVTNKQLILKENGFIELTEQERLNLLHQNETNETNKEFKLDLNELRREKVVSFKLNNVQESVAQQEQDNADKIKLDSACVDQSKLISSATSGRKYSSQSDELVVQLLKKYCKYSRDALDDEILNAIDATAEENTSETTRTRTRKLSFYPIDEKLYENCNDFENDRNEHVLRWLKQQNRRFTIDHPRSAASLVNKEAKLRRCSLPERLPTKTNQLPSPTDSRKSSLTSKSSGIFSSSRKSSVDSTNGTHTCSSRKSSVASNSESCCSESDDCNVASSLTWTSAVGRNPRRLQRLQKQREAWARNTRRKLSTTVVHVCDNLDAE